jgi:hypothetical protein
VHRGQIATAYSSRYGGAPRDRTSDVPDQPRSDATSRSQYAHRYSRVGIRCGPCHSIAIPLVRREDGAARDDFVERRLDPLIGPAPRWARSFDALTGGGQP